MAQFSLQQTLADIALGLPPGFDPRNGIRSLFPPGTINSIKDLANYHFVFTGTLHAVGVTCTFTVDAWGSGSYRFFGSASNGDIFDANYAIGFNFNFSICFKISLIVKPTLEPKLYISPSVPSFIILNIAEQKSSTNK